MNKLKLFAYGSVFAIILSGCSLQKKSSDSKDSDKSSSDGIVGGWVGEFSVPSYEDPITVEAKFEEDTVTMKFTEASGNVKIGYLYTADYSAKNGKLALSNISFSETTFSGAPIFFGTFSTENSFGDKMALKITSDSEKENEMMLTVEAMKGGKKYTLTATGKFSIFQKIFQQQKIVFDTEPVVISVKPEDGDANFINLLKNKYTNFFLDDVANVEFGNEMVKLIGKNDEIVFDNDFFKDRSFKEEFESNVIANISPDEQSFKISGKDLTLNLFEGEDPVKLKKQ